MQYAQIEKIFLCILLFFKITIDKSIYLCYTNYSEGNTSQNKMKGRVYYDVYNKNKKRGFKGLWR